MINKWVIEKLTRFGKVLSDLLGQNRAKHAIPLKAIERERERERKKERKKEREEKRDRKFEILIQSSGPNF